MEYGYIASKWPALFVREDTLTEVQLDETPGEMLDVGPVETDITKIIEPWWASLMRERGVTIERLQQAVAQVRSTYVPEDDGVDERGE
jgi:hypothetical protein